MSIRNEPQEATDIGNVQKKKRCKEVNAKAWASQLVTITPIDYS